MPRLPVNPDKPSGAAPLTLRVSWAALAVFAVLGLVWFFGIDVLKDWLSLDAACDPGSAYGRRARYGELVSCMLAQGPRGWLWLGWCAAYPLGITYSLERALRKLVKARGEAARSGRGQRRED